MKKLNNKGFMMIEILVVSTFIISVFIYLFVQFRSINHSYQISFKYNTANGLYAVNNIKNFLNYIDIINIENGVEDFYYVDISECPENFIQSTVIEYCEILFEKLNIEKVYITKQDLTDLKLHIKRSQFTPLDEDTKDFIDYIKYDYKVNGYRIVAKFNDGTFGTLKLR